MALRRWMPLLQMAQLAFLLTVWMPERVASSILNGNLFRLRPCYERCGLLGLSHVMHRGTPGSDTCRETCVMFPIWRLGLECGGCNPDAHKFDVTLRLDGIPPEDEIFFTQAKELWEAVITGDISDRRLVYRAPVRCNYPRQVDDVAVCGSYGDIDGPGGVLASASPDIVRFIGADAGLPLTGTMEFDEADVPGMKTRGTFSVVIKHEMAHILGIGTLWVRFGATGFEFLDCPYKGSNANAEYRAITGCDRVPTEDGGGGGTACSHWDEECMRTELMTGSPTRGENPLSRISIGSMADLGYSVSFSAAGNYTRAHVDVDCLCDESSRHLRHGEAQMLGANRTKPRRRLSDRGRQIAMDYGQTLLQERAQMYSLSRSDSSGGSSLEDDGLMYIGDQIVAVLVEDGDELFGVVVRRNDTA